MDSNGDPMTNWSTPYDHGCVGDGSDETVKLQAWLDSGSPLHGAVGTFSHAGSLIIRSGTAIHGDGASRFILRNIGGDSAVVQNANMQPDPASNRFDSDIELNSIGFVGESERVLKPNAEFVTFGGVAKLTIRDCFLGHRRGNLLVLVNNRDVRIESTDFEDWGILTHATPGDGQYVGGCAIFCQRPNYCMTLRDLCLRDGTGGIWLPVIDNNMAEEIVPESCILSGFQIFNVCEFGIVGVPRGTVVGPGIIKGVRRLDVSGHGMELHGDDWIVRDVIISDCDATGIYASNAQDAIINGVIARNCDRLQQGNRSIVLASHPPAANVGTAPPDGVAVQGCMGFSGLLVTDAGGGAAHGVSITGNDIGLITIGTNAVKKHGLVNANNFEGKAP